MKLATKGRRSGKVDQIRPQAAVQRLLEVEAWENIPYERPLYAPGCDPWTEVERAGKVFLSRNKVDCPVAATSHGQNLIVRLLRLPPIEAEKMRHVVRFEARQQIPFDLDDVEWRSLDLSELSGQAAEEDGFRLESEVALIAQKRTAVEDHVALAKKLRVKLKLLQAQPLALLNYLWSCHFGSPGAAGTGGQLLMLDVGARGSTLVITNGDTFWAHSIPVGGMHFTRQISRQCKLTFGAAEELKCSGTLPAEAAQGVEISMLDLDAEVKRSLSYFATRNRAASLAGIVFSGHGLGLAGAKERLAQSVGLPIVELKPEIFLEGSAVQEEAFRQNAPALVPAVDAAMEQLGIGKFMLNFLKGGKLPVRSIGSAWGIDIGDHALKAVRLRRREC